MDHSMLHAWHQASMAGMPPAVQIWDAHTHTGDSDPDGFTNSPAALVETLDRVGHAGAVVCTSADPSGYRQSNDRIVEEAARSAGRLVPFLRVDPTRSDAMQEVERCLAGGHRGIKLHPRSDGFAFDHPVVAEIAVLAARQRVPLLVHAGRGMEPLGSTPIRLLDSNPGLDIILAHCGISDLAQLASDSASRPGLHFDTAWWNPADLAALFGWVDAGQILYASDIPYGAPLMSATITLRAAVQAGISGSALGAVFGGNLRRILDGQPTSAFAVGVSGVIDPGLLRVASNLFGAIETAFAGVSRTQPLELALRATESSPGPHEGLNRAIHATVQTVLDLGESQPRDRLGLLVVACSAALTPAAGHPDF